jgi:hypothetical protein
MVSLMLMVAIGVFVLRGVCGFGSGHGPRMRRMGMHERWGRGLRSDLRFDLAGPRRQREPAAPVTAARAETPEESLQRRFAAGAISIEEYEREVGKLYGLK